MAKEIVIYTILDRGRILLEKRKDSDIYPGLWAFPSGHVEMDDKISTLLKEVKEETGITTEKYIFLGNMDFESGDDKSLLHVFLIIQFSGGAKQETDEGRELKWFSFDEANGSFNSGTPFHQTSVQILEKVVEAAKTLG